MTPSTAAANPVITSNPEPGIPMKNLETPARKVAIYGAPGSVGSALMVEALSRQYEATAILSDLNAITSRPGIRAKQGDLFDPISVSQSVAGMDAVVCVLSSSHLSAGDSERDARDFGQLFKAVNALLEGLTLAEVSRLLLIGDFHWMDEEALIDTPSQHLQDRLTESPIVWTLLDAPSVGDDALNFEQLAAASGDKDPAPLVAELQRFAAGALDELELNLHVHCRLQLIDQQTQTPKP